MSEIKDTIAEIETNSWLAPCFSSPNSCPFYCLHPFDWTLSLDWWSHSISKPHRSTWNLKSILWNGNWFLSVCLSEITRKLTDGMSDSNGALLVQVKKHNSTWTPTSSKYLPLRWATINPWELNSSQSIISHW